MEKNNFIERFWHVEELDSTIKIEVLAGITTFLTMAYIIRVNPAVLGAPALVDANYFYGGADPAAIQSALFLQRFLLMTV
ncbi:MAG: hypothetical protein RR310_09010 [Eubacterium sp.]